MAERVPGVITTITDDTGRIVPPTFRRYVTIIGVGDAYKLIQNRRMVRGAGTNDAIPTVTQVNTIVSVGDLPGISKYIDGADYQLSGDEVEWLAGGDEPGAGDAYYLTFTETRPASAYQPILYFNDNLAIANHGNVLMTTGQINDVTKGVQLALENGGKGVIALQLDLRAAVNPNAPTGQELENAFLACIDKLERITDAKLLMVGMSSGVMQTVTAANILYSHAILASQPERKQWRTVMMAMPAGTSYLEFVAAQAAYANSRMVVPAIPTNLSMPGLLGTYDSRYYCAALAGKLLSGGVGDTYYDEIISGITFGDSYNYTPDELEYLVQHSVSPAKSLSGVVRNVAAFTTDGTSALTEDLGVQDIKDYTAYAWNKKLWEVFRNKRSAIGLAGEIKSASENFLDTFIDKGTIANHRNVAAYQDITEPRKYRVTGQILPVFGVGWMDVDFVFFMSFV
ncbi:MAG: DUF4815 domain-containing protein [Candidatus Paceibacterota bacterium]